MRHSGKKKSLKTADFLGAFQPSPKRSKAESRTRTKRLLRELFFQDKEILEDIPPKNLPT